MTSQDVAALRKQLTRELDAMRAEYRARFATVAAVHESLTARLVALEPVLNVNLVPNPLPAWSQAEWNAYGLPKPGPGYFGWSTSPDKDDTASWDNLIVQPAGPTGVSEYSIMTEIDPSLTPGTYRVFPHEESSADPDYAVAVTAGGTYSLSCYTAAIDSGGATAAVGVVWLDGSLAEVSTATGTPVALDAVSAGWTWTTQSTGATEAFNLDESAEPSGSFTAPAGAVKARVFVELDVPSGWNYYVSAFDFERTA